MADSPTTIDRDERSAHGMTLVQDEAHEVSFAQDVACVEVLTDGTKAVYVAADGSTATVDGANTVLIPQQPTGVSGRRVVRVDGKVLSLIAHGAPKVSVTRLEEGEA